MAAVTEVWVNRKDYRETKIVNLDRRELEAGEIRVAIDKYGLTANNVSYAVSGDMIGYWKFYPAADHWGKVPVWGMADVVESNSDSIAVGERLWGFFPMASETILKVGKVSDDAFTDVTPHRLELPALYNNYRRTVGEPDYLKSLEVERCLLFPLFLTSFVLYDYLKDNDYFGADQVVIGSVSSKTGFGLAYFLHQDKQDGKQVVGLTSAANAAFVKQLDCCHQVVEYGREADISSARKTAYVDMSGNRSLTETLHHQFGDNMVESCMVGVTHWEQRGAVSALPGATPAFFFAPGQIAKRDKEWGPGKLFEKASEASAGIAEKISKDVTIEHIKGAEAAANIWVSMLNNEVAPSRGIMVSVGGA
ncbi:MAG: DUF2855 family protein [Henriciella sp.]